MEIYKGTSRTAVRIGNLIFKFPRIFFSIKRLWRERRYPSQVKIIKINLLNGFIANLSEFATWIIVKGDYLAPTYFSIGLVSVQKFIPGNKPKWEEIHSSLRKLPGTLFQEVQNINGHVFDPPNFKRTEEGLVMVDYGDSISQNHGSLSGFIICFSKQLSEIFLKEKTPPS